MGQAQILDGVKLDFDDVLIVPKSSINASRKAVNLVREFKFYHSSNVWKGVPILAANMDTTGTFAMAKVMRDHQMGCVLHKHYSVLDKMGQSLTDQQDGYNIESFGMDAMNHNMPPKYVCLDVANGYTNQFLELVSKMREKHGKELTIIAGNVCTPNMVERLIDHGADIVKIGVGGGSVCTTRLVAGVGYPQLSAIMECADAAHGRKSDEGRLGLICADGGCRTPGDICKAFAAGADFVMVGGMLTGTDECDGEWEYDVKWERTTHPTLGISIREERRGGKKALSFYGMSSYSAQDKHNGRKDYTASEGKKVSVPYKGPVADILKEIVGGLRSCCAYVGATDLRYLGDCASFVRVNRTHNRIFE